MAKAAEVRRARRKTLWIPLVLALATLLSHSAGAQLVSAVLPTSRSVAVGGTATAFATVINAGSTTATSCSIAPFGSFSGTFSYQTTNPATNALSGTINTPVNIAPGAAQSFVIALTPSAVSAPGDFQLSYSCANGNAAPISSGINTLLFSASTVAVADVIALGATATRDGTLHITGDTATGAFAVATANVGASSVISASVDTGIATLPVTLSICQTNPTTGQCLATATPSVGVQINAGATPTFAIFATANGPMPFQPSVNRIYVRFRDAGGVIHGATSVAVTTGEAASGALVQSVSSASPTPLSPLQLTVTGLDMTQPISLKFSNSAGYSVTDQPIRTTTGGLVVVAVPLYANPTTMNHSAGTVSLVLSQNGKSAAPITLNIQDLPTVASFGMSPGQISHDFLIHDTTLTGGAIGRLATAQLATGIDTSAARSALNTSFVDSIMARNDVDRVMITPSTVILGGIATDGNQTQFDSTSLDMMDRVIGVYLSEIYGSNASLRNGTLKGVEQPLGVQHGTAVQTSFATFVQALTQVNGAVETAKAVRQGQTSESTLDYALAVGKGINAYVGVLANAGGNSALEKNAGVAGGLFALYDVLDDTGKMLGDAYFLYQAADGTDPAVLQEAQNEIDQLSNKTFFDSAGLLLAAATLAVKETQVVANGVIQGGQFALNVAQAYATGGTASQTEVMEGQIASAMTTGSHFAEIKGQVNISNSQGIGAAQSGLDLCCFGAGSLGIIDVADTTGAYDTYVPLGLPSTSYGGLNLSVYDPVTSSTITSSTVSLTGATTTAPKVIPTLSGSCVDTDNLNPDGDDPDCD